jgi:hypothetical protein
MAEDIALFSAEALQIRPFDRLYVKSGSIKACNHRRRHEK